MASTQFQDYSQNTPIVAAWLNDINNGIYTAQGTAKKALQSAAAWVRFSVTGGTVAIQQSSNIATVVRTGTGVYVVTFSGALQNANNCYQISMSQAGFVFYTADSAASVTINAHDTTNAAVDPANVSLVVFGDN